MNATAIYRVALGKDRQPDAWQLALTTDAWPRVLIAPTGSGKTAAVTLGWAAHRLRSPDSTPRRLVWCLPMRTLVEQTAEVVKEWFGKLAKLAAAEVDGASRLPRPEDVHVLMGGVDDGGWLETPERPAVLVGTQDMLLSRALMRGYASSRAIWPMEFALLHEDSQWVFDEVQLMGAGRATSAQLEAFRQSGHGAGATARPPDGKSLAQPLDLGDPRPAVARHRGSSGAGSRVGRQGRSDRRARREACTSGARRQEANPFVRGAGIAEETRPHRLCRAARRRDPGRTPPRLDDARHPQSRRPGAAAPLSAREAAVATVRAGAEPGPRPLPLPPCRSRAGDEQGDRHR